jgi:hypothetical protein
LLCHWFCLTQLKGFHWFIVTWRTEHWRLLFRFFQWRLIVLCWARRRWSWVKNSCKFTKFVISNHLIAVVVNSAKDRFYVRVTRIVTVVLKVVAQIMNADSWASMCNIVENSHLNKVRRKCKLDLRFSSVLLKCDFSFE